MLSRVGPVAYRLDFPASTPIHAVFHVLQLRAAVGSAHSSPTLPPTINTELKLLVELEQLLDIRYSRAPIGGVADVEESTPF